MGRTKIYSMLGLVLELQMSLSLLDLYNMFHNVSAVTNMLFINLLYMMDDNMFTCYYCRAKMDDLLSGKQLKIKTLMFLEN